MDQETARVLLAQGGTLVLLGVPAGTEFGVDTAVWNTEEDFRGVKIIPPGLHYVHYAAVGGGGTAAPRSGFMHYFKKRDFIVRIWDKKLEDFSRDEISEESLQRLRDNLLSLDRCLAPYPYETAWATWKALTCHITEELVTKLTPVCGVIRSALELMSCSNEDRPRGKKSETKKKDIENDEQKSEANQTADTSASPVQNESSSGLKKSKMRFSMEEKEEALLPSLKPAPGTAIRFSHIPHDKYPEGASPQEITKHHLDQSYSLEFVIAQHNEPLQIIGELQFAFVSFLIGHSLDAFEHWKSLVVMLCSCDEALHKYTNVFCQFVRTLEVQIDETPEEFLADIVMNKNLVYKKLREFFKTALAAKVDGRLWTLIERFRDNLTEKLLWDFTGLDSEDEDERPVIVDLI